MKRVVKKDKWADVVSGARLDLSRPYNEVTAEQIKKFSGEEPRLMAYVDNEEDLPAVFRENGVFLLPVSRGSYAIVKGRGFHALEPAPSPKPFISRLTHSLVTMEGSTSEAARLSFAYNTGLLDHFSASHGLRQIWLGRGSTPSFEFLVNNRETRVAVKGAQIEIDGVYEDDATVVLAEAKMAPYRSFINRQLYYPLRRWHQPAAASGKDVRSLFVTADPLRPVYSIWEYRWPDLHDYEGIEFVRVDSFEVVPKPPAPEEFADVEPAAAGLEIPQANDLSKVMKLPLLVAQGIDDAGKVAEHFEFDRRQSSYYRRAAEALGLLSQDARTHKYLLTQKGEEYVRLNPSERFEFLTDALLELPIMNEVFRQALRRRTQGVSRADVAAIIRDNSSISGATPPRRASTILAWFRWMGDTLGIVQVEGDRIFVRSNRP